MTTSRQQTTNWWLPACSLSARQPAATSLVSGSCGSRLPAAKADGLRAGSHQL